MTCVQGKFALVLRDLIFVVGTQQGGWWSHYFAVDKLGPRPITFSQSHLLLRSMNSNGVSELGFHLIQLSLGRWCASLSWTLQIFWKTQNHGQVESRVVGLGHTSLNGNDPRRPREHSGEKTQQYKKQQNVQGHWLTTRLNQLWSVYHGFNDPIASQQSATTVRFIEDSHSD